MREHLDREDTSEIHSASEEVLGGRINSKLTIAVEKSLCNPLLESLHHVVDSDQLDDTLKLLPLHAGFLSRHCCAMTLPDIEVSFTKRKG